MVHIIHVGNMANKGTQALLACDVPMINEVVKGEVRFRVSTVDPMGVKALDLRLEGV